MQNRWSETFCLKIKLYLLILIETFFSPTGIPYLPSTKSAVALTKPRLCMCPWPHWPSAPLDAIDHTLFPGYSSPLVTLKSFELHFVILSHFESICHILSQFEEHFVIFWPSSIFLWGCHKDLLLIFICDFAPCFLVLVSTNRNLSYYVYVGGPQTCLLTPCHFYSAQTVVWGCFSDRSDLHLDINSSHHQHMAIVNIFCCCLFCSLFEGKVMKVSFPVSSLVTSCKSFCIPSFKDVVFLYL